MEFSFENVPQIIQAIFLNDKSILELPPNIDDVYYKDAQLRTPLHAAAHVGDVDFVEFLLKHNARVNAKDIKWYTPLHRACASDAHSVAQILLDNGADRNIREKSWLTPLHVAAYHGSLECARLLLFYNVEDGQCGTNINASDRGGHTPLHHAVYGGHLDMARLLLTNGASVNAFDKNDRRAMHWAAACSQTSIIDLLCEFGAEVNCRDKLHYTPLHVAAALGHVDVANQLMDHGAELDARTTQLNYPLHIACLNGKSEVLYEMLKRLEQTEFNAPGGKLTSILAGCNTNGYNPFHLASLTLDNGGCLEKLVTFCKRFDEEHPVDLSTSQAHLEVRPLMSLETAGGRNSWTPLHVAAVYGRHRQAQTLLRMGANIEAVDRHGNTPLHLAASRGHELVVTTLLLAGAKWNSRGNGGATPLHCAAVYGYSACFNRLFEVALVHWEKELTESERPRSEVDGIRFPSYARQLSNLVDDQGRNLVHASALGGSIECLRSVLLQGGSPIETDMLKRTALHFAIISLFMGRRTPAKCSSTLEVVRVLLKLGADPNRADTNGCTPMHLAAAFDKDGYLMRTLLKYGGDRFCVMWRHPSNNCFSQASSETSCRSSKSDLDITGSGSNIPSEVEAQSLLDNNIQPSTTALEDHTMVVYYPLHLAAALGNKQVLKQLLKDVPLKTSCQLILDSSKMVKFEESAEKNATSRYFYSPLFLAAYRGHTECVEVLLNACKATGKLETPASSASGSVISIESETDEEFEELIPGESIFRHPPLNEKRPCGSLTDPLGRTSLHYAAHAGHLETCQFLVEHPLSQADPLAKDGILQWTAIHHAAAQGHCPVLSYFLRWYSTKWGVSPDPINIPDDTGRTPLMLAAQNQRIAAIQLLSAFTTRPQNILPAGQRKIDSQIFRRVNRTDKMGRTALHRTAVNGQTEAMKILHTAGASLNAADSLGRQALHMAAASGHVHTLTFICDMLDNTISGDNTASVIAPKDKRGFTPLHLAAFLNRSQCVHTLLKYEVYLTPRGNTFSPVHCAAGHRDTCSLEVLLNALGPSTVFSKDARGSTPLHIAAIADNVEGLMLMLEVISKKPSSDFTVVKALHMRDKRDRVPIMSAIRHGSLSAFKYLLNIHQNVDEDINEILSKMDCFGYNLLHQAVTGPEEGVALHLIQQLYNRDWLKKTTGDGHSPLHLAVESGFADVVVELLKLGCSSLQVDADGRLPICGVTKNAQHLKILRTLLTEMMPQSGSILQTSLFVPSRNPMTESIRSSDTDFY